MTIIERARLWLEATPGAVENQGGHNHTFYVANTLIHGWLLGGNEALGLMHEWNRRCTPPWKTRELNHKLGKSSTSKPRTQFDEDDYLNSLSGEWHSYVDMIKAMQERFGMSKDEAKTRWTALKPRLSTKTPQQSGKEWNTYTFI